MAATIGKCAVDLKYQIGHPKDVNDILSTYPEESSLLLPHGHFPHVSTVHTLSMSVLESLMSIVTGRNEMIALYHHQCSRIVGSHVNTSCLWPLLVKAASLFVIAVNS